VETNVSIKLLRLMETSPELWMLLSLPRSPVTTTKDMAKTDSKRLNDLALKKADSVLPESAFTR